MRSVICTMLIVCLSSFAVKPNELPKDVNRDALAIRNYIDWQREEKNVEKVVVHIDTITFYGSIAALVTVTSFMGNLDSVNVSMKIGFESIENPEIAIVDTVYLKGNVK